MTESRKTPFLQRRDRWGHGAPLWIVVAIAFILPTMGWALSGITMHNDVGDWLPKDDPQARIRSWYQDMFPSKDRVLVSWDDCSITDARLIALQKRLEGTQTTGNITEGGSPYVLDVTLPSEVLKRMLGNGVKFETALEQLDGVLIGKGPLKIRYTGAGRLRGDYMESELLDLLKKQFQISATVVTGDMELPVDEGILLEDRDAWKVHDQLTEYVQALPLYDLQIEWPEMHADADKFAAVKTAILEMVAPAAGSQTAGKPCVEECFTTLGSLAAVSVSLSEAGAADRAKSVAAILEAVESLGTVDLDRIPSNQVHVGGQPIVTVALNQAVADAAWSSKYATWDLPHRSPIFFSAFVSVLFSFVMLKSMRLATLVQAVSFLTVIVAVALVPLTGGTMNMVLIVMPTLLVVLTTSAAIHLSNYWKHSGESDPGLSIFAATKIAWLPCALASGTTAIGLASLLSSGLVPVRDFGMYSAIGCIISFVVVLYVLPSLMLYWPRSPPPAEESNTQHWKSFGIWLARHRYFVSACCLMLTATAGWGLWQFRTETKVIRYFPEDSRLVQDYVFLEDKLSGVISIDTIVKFDEQGQDELSFIERARLVKELQMEIRKHPEISGVLSLASFLDLRDGKSGKLSATQRMKLNAAHRSIQKKIYDRLEDKDNNPSLAAMFAVPQIAADWKVPGDQRLNRKGDEIWRITAQASVLSDLDLEVLIGDMDTIAEKHLGMVGSPHTGHVVTGLIPIFLRTQKAVLESLILSFGMAFVIIAIVMMVLLRSPLAGLCTMLPNLMPVILVFGLLSWMQLRVDIGTMITASVALGIAVDGTLHLITWFQELMRRGIDVEEAVGLSLEHCGPAMWQTSAAVGLGMLALLPAELLLVSRFGWIMAALIFSALVADVIFLPALLGGTLGRLIQASANRESGSGRGGASGESFQGDSSAPNETPRFPDSLNPAAATSSAALKDLR